MNHSLESINRFFEKKSIAVVGVSRNPTKFTHKVFTELSKKGYDMYPVNPNANEIMGVKCYHNIMDLPNQVDSVLIATPKEATDLALQQSIKKDISNIWIQQSSETNNSQKIAKDGQKDVIMGKCIFMFAEPVKGVHKFHRSVLRVFGQLPK